MSDAHVSEEDLLVFALEGQASFSAEMQQKIHEHLDVCESCTSCVAEARRELGSCQNGPSSGHVRLLRRGDLLSDRYRITRYVASGGMGDVYQAQDTRLSDTVIAIKTLNIAGAGEASAISRLVREAKVALKVSHPQACRVHHYDVHLLPRHQGEVHFLTMEWIDGVTLSDHLEAHGPLSLPEAKAFSLQVLSALAAAHKSGILHRDLKPSNIMLRQNNSESCEINAVIMDFGLAKPLFESGDQLTPISSAFLGSAKYASPEQLMAEKLTPSSDLYSFGVVLFEALTGQLPFRGSGALETALMRVDEPAPQMSMPQAGVQIDWQRLVARCLERKTNKRFESAEALVVAAEALLSPAKWRWDWVMALLLGVAMGLSVGFF